MPLSCVCRSMVFGPAREWPWIAAVYRPFGHVAGTISADGSPFLAGFQVAKVGNHSLRGRYERPERVRAPAPEGVFGYIRDSGSLAGEHVEAHRSRLGKAPVLIPGEGSEMILRDREQPLGRRRDSRSLSRADDAAPGTCVHARRVVTQGNHRCIATLSRHVNDQAVHVRMVIMAGDLPAAGRPEHCGSQAVVYLLGRSAAPFGSLVTSEHGFIFPSGAWFRSGHRTFELVLRPKPVAMHAGFVAWRPVRSGCRRSSVCGVWKRRAVTG